MAALRVLVWVPIFAAGDRATGSSSIRPVNMRSDAGIGIGRFGPADAIEHHPALGEAIGTK